MSDPLGRVRVDLGALLIYEQQFPREGCSRKGRGMCKDPVATGNGRNGWSRAGVGQDELAMADLCRTSGPLRALSSCVSFSRVFALFVLFTEARAGQQCGQEW